jgi:hypothetical protein
LDGAFCLLSQVRSVGCSYVGCGGLRRGKAAIGTLHMRLVGAAVDFAAGSSPMLAQGAESLDRRLKSKSERRARKPHLLHFIHAPFDILERNVGRAPLEAHEILLIQNAHAFYSIF